MAEQRGPRHEGGPQEPEGSVLGEGPTLVPPLAQEEQLEPRSLTVAALHHRALQHTTMHPIMHEALVKGPSMKRKRL